MWKTNGNKGNGKAGGSAHRLPLSLKLYSFVIPVAIGFLVAFAVLLITGPFHSRYEWLAWLLISTTVSVATSMLAGDKVRRLVKKTKAFRNSKGFDTEVDELFGSYLRDGNARALRSDALRIGHDPEFVDNVITQLDEITGRSGAGRGHVDRVRAYSSLIGTNLNLTQPELELLNWAALFHDAGKVDVASSNTDEIAAEIEIDIAHPDKAKAQLADIEAVLGEGIYDGALYHHERWDGEGYPSGLTRGETPLFGRIIAIADAFDAMTHSRRKFASSISVSEARKELMSSAGAEFDPDLITTFTRIDDQDLAEVRGSSTTFAGLTFGDTEAFSMLTQVAMVATALAGAAVATLSMPNIVPQAIPQAVAFVDQANTVPLAPNPPIADAAAELLDVTYMIDEVQNPTDVAVFLDGMLHSTQSLVPGQEVVEVTFDLVDPTEEDTVVRFELFLGDDLLRSDEFPISD